FFFSSGRRHTSSKRDWSSDVCSSDLIKGLLAVVVPAFGLLRVGERDAKFLQRLFLLGTQLPVAVLTVKDVPLMDVGRPLVQMERPVQDVDMRTDAALTCLIKLID